MDDFYMKASKTKKKEKKKEKNYKKEGKMVKKKTNKGKRKLMFNKIMFNENHEKNGHLFWYKRT